MTVGQDRRSGLEDPPELAGPMRALLEALYPLHRTVAGPGARATLARIGERIPLQVHEVPTGTKVYDWTIPREWHIRDAWVADAAGRRVIDYGRSNLHVVGHSRPIHATVDRAELLAHLHSRPTQPDVIPYHTSPYLETWGFCDRQRSIDALTDDRYEVHIDADLIDGALSYGECVLPGTTDEEVIVSTHTCHPSLANDNVSGMVVSTFLAAALAERPHRYTYRFLFAPGTIGAIAWLARNEATHDRIRHGLIIAGVGDAGGHTYKRSFGASAGIDRAVELALRDHGGTFAVEAFRPWGYDERQYNAPGFRLPFGRLSRTPHGTYPEYHTSADDLDFVHDASLTDSLALLLEVVDILERDRRPVSTAPYGEPRLNDRGLMSGVGGRPGVTHDEFAVLWVLSMADGDHSLLDIADRSSLPFTSVADAADALTAVGLLEPPPS